MKISDKAYQVMIDCYGCDGSILDSQEKIREIIHRGCEEINTEIVEECYHKFEPIGLSAMAVITSSHFSVHTWPENGYAAIDIFSCSEDIPDMIGEYMGKMLKAEEIKMKKFERVIKREEVKNV